MKETDTTEVVELLESYSAYYNHLHAQKYAKTYFNRKGTIHYWNKEECIQKIDFIKELIAGLPQSKLSTLLKLHYIDGLTLNQCSECMDYSHAQIYRILQKAKIAANNRYQEMKQKQKEKEKENERWREMYERN